MELPFPIPATTFSRYNEPQICKACPCSVLPFDAENPQITVLSLTDFSSLLERQGSSQFPAAVASSFITPLTPEVKSTYAKHFTNFKVICFSLPLSFGAQCSDDLE